MKNVLGVAQWILAPAFSQEVTGHADVHVRFLGPKLAAVAWSRDNPEDRERIACLEARVAEALPGIHIMRLPLRSEGPHYASPVNWLQFGRHLLLPRYDLTPAEDIHAIKQTLADRGFHITFIHSPTLEYAGSLHCLTASVYA
jgi:agmatine/peptidylarginine deiminase